MGETKLIKNVCCVCGISDDKVERYGFTDASGNNDYEYKHEKCPEKELKINQQLLDVIDDYINSLQTELNKLRRLRN